METNIYRFVGVLSQVGDRQFDAIGQRIELPNKEYTDVVRGGAAFIPEAAYQQIGFTDEETTTYAPDKFFGQPPAEFMQKIERAREVFREIYALVTRRVV